MTRSTWGCPRPSTGQRTRYLRSAVTRAQPARQPVRAALEKQRRAKVTRTVGASAEGADRTPGSGQDRSLRRGWSGLAEPKLRAAQHTRSGTASTRGTRISKPKGMSGYRKALTVLLRPSSLAQMIKGRAKKKGYLKRTKIQTLV